MAPRPSSPAAVRCREITTDDLDAIAALLTDGFAGRTFAYWRRGLARQEARDVPAGYPRFGFMLDHESGPVGVLLLVYSAQHGDDETFVRCNLSSWYVKPAFRNYASLLTSMAQRNKQVSFVNATPAPTTWPIIEAQGFRRYCSGLFVSVPALTFNGAGRVEEVTARSKPIAGLSTGDWDRLVRHASYGCLSLVCHTQDGPKGFILQRWRVRRGRIPLPAMHLIWCSETADISACAGSLGRALLMRLYPILTLNANGPLPGLIGHYTEKRGVKYARGPHPPRLHDLADTELVLYGY